MDFNQPRDERPTHQRPADTTEAQRGVVLRLYADAPITAEEAADRLGPGVAVVEVILETRRLFNRLPDRRDAFIENEYRWALAILGLDRSPRACPRKARPTTADDADASTWALRHCPTAIEKGRKPR